MADFKKIDSNVTGLRYAEEESLGVLGSTPVWYPLEPNSYKDFGGQVKTESRNPINASRQKKKGVIVDLDAMGGFEVDLTQEGFQRLMQGFMFAAFRTKHELIVPDVDGSGNAYLPDAGGATYVAGDLLFAKYASDSRNNGLKVVTGSPSAMSVPVTDTTLVNADYEGIVISRVGFEFTTGDLTIDANGGTNGLPALKSVTKDFTELGLIPGEWVCIGDDATANQFATSGCNGLARVKDVAAHVITLDKAPVGLVDEAGTGKTIRLFFGRVLKNESDPSLISRRTYQFERTLGKPATDSPADQSEYLVGGCMDELEISLEQAKKAVANLSFIATEHETRTPAQGLKAGLRPSIVESDAFNSTSNVVRFALSVIDPVDATPEDLFAFLTELSIKVSNGIKANKAIKVLGAFDTSAGQFEVTASATAYFTKVEALRTVRQNDDVTLDLTVALNNQGWTLDIPLIGVSDALADVKADAAIMLPLSVGAGTAAKYGLDHTLLIVFWDYLPSLAA